MMHLKWTIVHLCLNCRLSCYRLLHESAGTSLIEDLQWNLYEILDLNISHRVSERVGASPKQSWLIHLYGIMDCTGLFLFGY
jgi:hypothetical protein